MPSTHKLKTRRILLLSANPKGTPPLRLDEEFRRITDALERNRKGNGFDIRVKPAITVAHIRRALLDHQPEIVHFCGHGAGTDGIACEDEAGRVKLIPTAALAGLFELAVAHVKCVVLNACYAEVQADEVAKHIECVVGMKYSIGDQAALSFAEGFYDALGADRPFDECFRWGVNAIQLQSIPEDLTPVLKKRGETHSAECVSPPQAPNNIGLSPKERMNTMKLWKVLLATSLVVAFAASTLTWAVRPLLSPGTKIPRVAGHYTQKRFDPPIPPYKDFTVQSLASSLIIYVEPASGTLSATEISTNQISHVEPDGHLRPVAIYTAEWKFDEVEQLNGDSVRMQGAPAKRPAFDKLIPFLQGASSNLVGDFKEFSEHIRGKFNQARSLMELHPDGSLERTNWYSGEEVEKEDPQPRVNTFYRVEK
jgi:hypothetical protein